MFTSFCFYAKNVILILLTLRKKLVQLANVMFRECQLAKYQHRSKEKLWFGWLEWLVFLIVMGCLHYKNKKKEGLSLQNNVSHQCSQLKVQVIYATEMAIFFQPCLYNTEDNIKETAFHFQYHVTLINRQSFSPQNDGLLFCKNCFSVFITVMLCPFAALTQP